MSVVQNVNSAYAASFHPFVVIITDVLANHFGVNPERCHNIENEEKISWNLHEKDFDTKFEITLLHHEGEVYFGLEYILGELPDECADEVNVWLLSTTLLLFQSTRLGVRTSSNKKLIIYHTIAPANSITEVGLRRLLIEMPSYGVSLIDDLMKKFNIKPLTEEG